MQYLHNRLIRHYYLIQNRNMKFSSIYKNYTDFQPSFELDNSKISPSSSSTQHDKPIVWKLVYVSLLPENISIYRNILNKTFQNKCILNLRVESTFVINSISVEKPSKEKYDNSHKRNHLFPLCTTPSFLSWFTPKVLYRIICITFRCRYNWIIFICNLY